MLPNKYDVYLHDTPSQELFEKTRRDFSSGCIRVKNPVDLAEWVLHTDQDWPRERLDSAIDTGKETRVMLKRPVPVHFLYWTVVANDDNEVRFIEDIYDRDKRVLSALNTKPPRH
jgi:murein L,D-transpeptidase YcbB/YkuD